MVKERLEEAHNSPKGNFYFFSYSLFLFVSPLGGALEGFGSLLFSAFFLSCFIKISK